MRGRLSALLPRSPRVAMVASGVCAVVAAVVLRSYVAGASAAADEGPVTRVVVVADAVARGEAVAASALRVEAVPQRYAPPGALTSIEEASGRVALTDLAAGEVVTQTRLARVRAGPVASLVPQGLRAFAVPTSLPRGALSVGDHVDVLATYGGGPVGQPHTETVVEGVEILFVLGGDGAGSSGIDLDVSAAGGGSPQTLILLVSQYQEERLAFARAFANLEVAVAPPPEEPAA